MTEGDPATDERQAGASGAGGGAPRPLDVDPLYFRREPMVEDRWLDPETGAEYDEPDARSGARSVGVLGLVFTVLGALATAMMLAGEWHVPVFDAELHAFATYFSQPEPHRSTRIRW